MARDRARMWQHAAIFGAVLMMLAAGSCIFAGQHGGTSDAGMSPDLCLGMLAVALTVVSLWRPFMSGWADMRRPVALASLPIHVLDPPPRLTARS